jgi:hypothetical protein
MKNDDIFYDCLTKDGGGDQHRKLSSPQAKEKQLMNNVDKNTQSRSKNSASNGSNCTKNVVSKVIFVKTVVIR